MKIVFSFVRKIFHLFFSAKIFVVTLVTVFAVLAYSQEKYLIINEVSPDGTVSRGGNDWARQTIPIHGRQRSVAAAIGAAGNIFGVITEIAPSEADGNDWVEIYITADCNVAGAQLFEGDTLVVTLPDITAKKGEFIVVRFNSALTSESGTSLSAGDTNRNGSWDVYSTDTGLTGTDNVISLRRGDGSFADGVVYSNRDGETFSDANRGHYAVLVVTNQWSPASTADWVAADFENNSANWMGGGGGESLSRKKTIQNEPQDNNDMHDWELRTRQTPGWGYGGAPLVTEKILEVKTPNPFSPHQGEEANISFSATRTSVKTLSILDVYGREIRRLIDQDKNLVDGGMLTGQDRGFIEWDGKDEAGNIVPVSIYILVMEAYDTLTQNVARGKATVVVGRRF